MKIIITGASGYVGSVLIPELAKANHELLLVGRNNQNLKKRYPKLNTCDYSDIIKSARNFDILINLAVINNNSNQSLKNFIKVNKNFLFKLVELSKLAKIKYFLNVGSFLQLNPNDFTFYAISKREGTKKINQSTGIKILNVYMPYVYGKQWSQKLKILNIVPFYLSKKIFNFISAFYPTVNINKFSNFLNSDFKKYKEKNFYLYDEKTKNVVYIFFSQLFNILFSVNIILIFGWLFILIYFLILLERNGNPIFVQKRIGKEKKVFNLLKFRTMSHDTKERATHLINETKVTKLGKFLRFFKLDELPQIFNILRNEINFIGPRPSLLSQQKLIKQRDNKKILSIKPGLTGYSQINHIDMSNINKLVDYDHYYLINQSLFFDLKIIMRTFLGIGFKDNVNK